MLHFSILASPAFTTLSGSGSKLAKIEDFSEEKVNVCRKEDYKLLAHQLLSSSSSSCFLIIYPNDICVCDTAIDVNPLVATRHLL